jgi:hypothetical protein
MQSNLRTAQPGGAAAPRGAGRRMLLRSVLGRRHRLGGPEGNEILTAAIGAVLTVLLVAEGITIIFIGGLLSLHMFIGLLLVPPILLKLSSIGYRFARYYLRSRPYREKGPPALPLRLMAPALVVTTIAVFATGIWLLLLGHKSDQMLFFHKLFFFVWGALFLIHFLAYAPAVLRSLRTDWSAARRHAVPGSGIRGILVAASLGAGTALSLSLLSTIGGWHGG